MSEVSATTVTKVKRRRTRRQHEGIEVRHARSCPARAAKTCACTPSYQAQVWSRRDQKPLRKTFATIADAKAWRQESQVALRKGMLRAPSPTSLAEAAEEWLEAAQAGVVRTRSGDRYKPSALRSRTASSAQRPGAHSSERLRG